MYKKTLEELKNRPKKIKRINLLDLTSLEKEVQNAASTKRAATCT